MWKKDYEDPAKFDAMTKGKVWRMGSNHWTTLDTSLPLKISGGSVPAGSYFLGLKRSADGGRWSLAFIDPAAVRKARLDAFDIRKAAVRFDAPMSVRKSTATADKLTVTLSYPNENIKHVNPETGVGEFRAHRPSRSHAGRMSC